MCGIAGFVLAQGEAFGRQEVFRATSQWKRRCTIWAVFNGEIYNYPALRGSLRAMLWDNLTSTTFLERGIISKEFVKRWLWLLLMLELFLEDTDRQRAA